MTLPLREHFIHWVMNENGVELHNELILCDPEHFLIKVLGEGTNLKFLTNTLMSLLAVGFCSLKST